MCQNLPRLKACVVFRRLYAIYTKGLLIGDFSVGGSGGVAPYAVGRSAGPQPYAMVAGGMPVRVLQVARRRLEDLAEPVA